MSIIHIFLTGQPDIDRLNCFILRAQQDFNKEHNISLRAMDRDKHIHIGSYQSSCTDVMELHEKPPALIPLHLKVTLKNQLLYLHVTLGKDEVLHHQVVGSPGLQLHHTKLVPPKYSKLEDKTIFEDVLYIKHDTLLL